MANLAVILQHNLNIYLFVNLSYHKFMLILLFGSSSDLEGF